MNKIYALVRNAQGQWVPASEVTTRNGKGRRFPNRRLLSAALTSSLVLLAGNAVALEGPIVAQSGNALSLENVTVTGSGTLAPASTLQAKGKDSVLAADNVNAIATGDNAYAAYASSGGLIEIIGGQMQSEGRDGHAIVASDSGSVIDLSKGSTQITTTGHNGSGASARSGGLIKLNSDHITTTGTGASGTAAAGGGRIEMLGGSINSTGAGLYSMNAGSFTLADGVAIQSLSHGAIANSGSYIQINGGSIQSAGKGVYANSKGSVVDLSDQSRTEITTRGDHDYAAYALSGTVLLNNDVLTTSGTAASALRAHTTNGVDGSLNALNVTGNTSGDSAFGGWASSGATITLADSYLNTEGTGAHGLYTEKGSTITVDGGMITTLGRGSYGALADGAGSVLDLSSAASTAIDTHGDLAIGLYVRKEGVAKLEGDQVTTLGSQATGMHAASNSSIISNRTTVATSGENSYGLRAEGAGGLISFDGGSITAKGMAAGAVDAKDGALIQIGRDASAMGAQIATHGDSAYALWARTGGEVHVTGATIKTEGNRGTGPMGSSAAVASSNSQITLTDTDISTSGFFGEGVTSEGPGSVLVMTGGSITTTGDSAKAAVAYNGDATLTLNGVEVTTSGADARGVHAAGAGTRALLTGGSVTTHGNGESIGLHAKLGADITASGTTVATGGANAHALYAQDGSVTVDNSRITTTGAGAIGAIVEAAADTTSSVVLKHAVLVSQGSAFDARGNGASRIALDAVQAEGQDGVLLSVSGEGNVSFVADQSLLTGDMHSLHGGHASASLANGSHWTGSAQGVNDLRLDSSLWTMTGDSRVGTAALADSVIDFHRGNGGYKTLTVEGDFVAKGSTLMINTHLASDDAPTDKLHVMGNTSGQAVLMVHNLGGAGAQTYADGIQVVQVDGHSDAEFALSGRAVAGAYEYLLAKGGKSDPNDGDWYLRSELPTRPEPEGQQPESQQPESQQPESQQPESQQPEGQDPKWNDRPMAPTPKQPLYRPETGAYLANQAAAMGMFQHTLHERLGELDFSERQRGDDRTKAVWVRMERDQFSGKTGDGQIDTHTDTSVLQVGTELAQWRDGDSRIHLGVMGGLGQANSRISTNILDTQAKGQVKGKSLGVYSTWYQDAKQPTGAYVDAWVQYSDFDHTVHGDALRAERYGSQTLTGSVEAGYAIQLGRGETHGLYLEPQVQAVYTDYRGGDHVEANGTRVRSVDAGGVTTRVGARTYTRALDGAANRVQPFVEANWWHHGGQNRIAFDSKVLAQDRAQDVYELKAGAQMELGGGWTGWGELGVQTGDGKDQKAVSGLLGVKRRW